MIHSRSGGMKMDVTVRNALGIRAEGSSSSFDFPVDREVLGEVLDSEELKNCVFLKREHLWRGVFEKRWMGRSPPTD